MRLSSGPCRRASPETSEAQATNAARPAAGRRTGLGRADRVRREQPVMDGTGLSTGRWYRTLFSPHRPACGIRVLQARRAGLTLVGSAARGTVRLSSGPRSRKVSPFRLIQDQGCLRHPYTGNKETATWPSTYTGNAMHVAGHVPGSFNSTGR